MVSCIHDYDAQFERAVKRLHLANINKSNKKLILEFVDFSLSESISKARIAKYIHLLKRMSIWLGKSFKDADENDIRAICRKIELTDYEAFTKAEHKITLRKFYKWLRKTEDYPPEVRWMRPRAKIASSVKMPEELLTEHDIKVMVRSAGTERDRAFIAMLYESGCRIGEILSIKNKHVRFDDYGAVISVDGKTGPRRIRLVSSVPFLKEWINIHPDPDNPDAFVWCKKNKELVKYTRVVSILKDTAKRAGIKKRIYPHLFRHSRATILANFFTEAQMKEYFGWVQASDMAGIYVHMSGRDVDNAILKMNGIEKKEEKKKPDLAIKMCVKCGMGNECTSNFCKKCGRKLIEYEEGERNRTIDIVKGEKRELSDMEKLMNDKDVMKLMLRKLKEWNE